MTRNWFHPQSQNCIGLKVWHFLCILRVAICPFFVHSTCAILDSRVRRMSPVDQQKSCKNVAHARRWPRPRFMINVGNLSVFEIVIIICIILRNCDYELLELHFIIIRSVFALSLSSLCFVKWIECLRISESKMQFPTGCFFCSLCMGPVGGADTNVWWWNTSSVPQI